MFDRTKMVSASTLAGTAVRNPHGVELGHVDELVIDLDGGIVRFVVVKIGGLLGIGGDQFIAVPWKSLQYSSADEHFLLEMDKATFDTAPKFERRHWPKMNDLRWSSAVHDFFSATPYWQ